MSDFIELLVDSLKHVRVGVSDVQHADSGEKVEECVPVDVPDGCTFGLLDRNRYATRVSDGVAVDLVAGPTTVPFVVRGPCPRLAPSKSGSRRSVGLLPCVKTLVRVYIFRNIQRKAHKRVQRLLVRIVQLNSVQGNSIRENLTYVFVSQSRAERRQFVLLRVQTRTLGVKSLRNPSKNSPVQSVMKIETVQASSGRDANCLVASAKVRAPATASSHSVYSASL